MTSLWLIDLPTPVEADVSALGVRLDCELGDSEVEAVWPEAGETGELFHPGLAFPGSTVFGEAVGPDAYLVQRIVLLGGPGAPAAERERFIARISEFRRAWLLWIGILTGQLSSSRWPAPVALRDRQGISQVLGPDDSGVLQLVPSEVQTRSVRNLAAAIGAFMVDREILTDSWARTVSGEVPPLSALMFQQAREAFQRHEDRVAMLEAASALELVWWDKYQQHVADPSETKDMTLGRLAGALAEIGILDNSPGSASALFVSLRNRLTHHPDKDYYHGECVEGLNFVLGEFRDRYPDLYATPPTST